MFTLTEVITVWSVENAELFWSLKAFRVWGHMNSPHGTSSQRSRCRCQRRWLFLTRGGVHQWSEQLLSPLANAWQWLRSLCPQKAQTWCPHRTCDSPPKVTKYQSPGTIQEGTSATGLWKLGLIWPHLYHQIPRGSDLKVKTVGLQKYLEGKLINCQGLRRAAEFITKHNRKLTYWRMEVIFFAWA